MITKDQHIAISRIYDTAIQPGNWRRALDSICELSDARAAALVVRGRRAGARDLTLMSSVYLEFSRTLSGMYYGAWLSRLQNSDWDVLRSQPLHAPTPDAATHRSNEELDRRRDYRYLRRHTGVSRRLGVRLNADEIWFDAMSLGFDQQYSDVPASAPNAISDLLPHITKALEIGRTFTVLKARYNAALSVLDKVQAGVAIALPNGELIARNAEASRILEARDGLHLTESGHLATNDDDLSAQIAAHIAEASETATGRAGQHEALVSVPRPSEQSPLLLDIAPISDLDTSDAELQRGLDGALITIVDPDRVPYLRLERFQKLYDLTPAETEVCSFIIQGMKPAEIADIRNTSPTTAKNQVSSVLEKAGVSSRAEFIRLILRVLPPVI